MHRSERDNTLESFELDRDQGSMRPQAEICNVEIVSTPLRSEPCTGCSMYSVAKDDSGRSNSPDRLTQSVALVEGDISEDEIVLIPSRVLLAYKLSLGFEASENEVE